MAKIAGLLCHKQRKQHLDSSSCHAASNLLRAILLWVKTWVNTQTQKIHTEKFQLPSRKTKEKVQKPIGFWTNFGCGGRTRTYDLRVMSPTSFQLLYSAILHEDVGRHSLEYILAQSMQLVNKNFSRI